MVLYGPQRLRFNNATQPELVDEINAQQARYAYYLRLARERALNTVPGFALLLILQVFLGGG